MKFILYSGLFLAFASATLAAVSTPVATQLQATLQTFEGCGFKVSNFLDNNAKTISVLAGPKVAQYCGEVSDSIAIINATIYGGWEKLIAAATDVQFTAIGKNIKTLSDATCKLNVDVAAAVKAKSLPLFKTTVSVYIKSCALATGNLIDNLNKIGTDEAKDISEEVDDLLYIAAKLKKALSI
ncbi:uncharacterized protein LOC129748588 [Uranotaenia lowii]|uniref:uncharacterized protein LOC129748588 n=1 Tax=Uranotaenia lowii TaxID=190385 RepID=UPI0024797C2C|nr:uncharacterized protein LOC129748588 [Uranotaenia lowii]